ncbi:MAG: tRNA (adenosine(37)-N6)-threonylcarbamoyltransferase complex transferase subunit TsaD [Microcystis aeruginosa Ma_QC_Ch_20071001_S25]|jgi:N6-L-threonylcarbamoyladenine synthase|uniref:tRNA N6-adenosine threonylcarbamoyltransferase n=1 Tax=Microcystis aeruginosa Ma_QC_Ch_20071001_S25D TaxID=2486250 RepID=A0A552FLR8_MICAE|nr:tRNA (adenosine(37)-N6)-threonylcarbamoyltransferase complex transferase subunit TsaD [Microcystis sp. M113S1]MCA2941227.1 tRNA (adenosine(37)-N6)-threonylcarbamoyltransferase complex transferase subunit TsaD [Microcystis sp. M113S1]TRU45020.1 MAG: tRNA (adenosine(37)-N6)-threonylcarbamoyltransferase complex transferase subunit TsaD [Microcystis aeruginosa Ma_QC_Ch_20071001_S25]TRU47649.1 MAG: tRNA (adenosine(37)-N6)-threonylcarbamoyltransferase complex transferase subunit TsaD [Microcystis a
MTIILAIETSCDETAVAIVNNNQVLSSVVSSQIDLHRLYGGVVPEMASRQHLETINFCLEKAWQETGLNWSEIDGIAATVAPGLVGALMVGMTAAKTLAIVHDKPFIGIHHLEGHIYASYLAESDLKPPFLSLLVSGGHTSLIHVQACGKYQQLGTTRDDAAGEAFDKVARLLNLSYPGGPIIDRMAKDGNPQAFPLPEGKISLPTGGFHAYDSSFSGLKTAVLRLVEKFEPDNLPVADIAASFQDTVARSLTRRTINCALDYGLKTIAIGGGVAANSALRNHLETAAKNHHLTVYFPPLKLCTDNAAMIARAAVDHYDLGHFSDLSLGVRSRLPLSEVMQLYNTSDSAVSIQN